MYILGKFVMCNSPPLLLLPCLFRAVYKFKFCAAAVHLRTHVSQNYPEVQVGRALGTAAMSIDPSKVAQLEEFVALCKARPAVLHLPELAFFKEWLLS